MLMSVVSAMGAAHIGAIGAKAKHSAMHCAFANGDYLGEWTARGACDTFLSSRINHN
jgi:hypothetical protein